MQVTQFLIRCRELDPKEATEFVWGVGLKDDTMVPDCFNPAKLGSIDIEGVTHWDEIHVKPIVGGRGHSSRSARVQIRYPRDASGKLDASGELGPRLVQKKFKYKPHENRYAFGCAMVRQDEQLDGKRLPLFDYSGQNIVSITQWLDDEKQEMARVRALAGDGAPWITGKRQKGELYLLDSVKHVLGVGEVAKAKLNTAGIATVQQLQGIATDAAIEGIGAAAVARYKANSMHAKAGAFPASRIKNHKLSANPYLSLYGQAWKDKIAGSVAMNKSVCITKLVTHIITHSIATYRGTKHEFTWMFIHDALPLLASAECREWMSQQIIQGPTRTQTRTYLDCWVRPQAGLNAGTIYEHRPVGNSPELMAWDVSTVLLVGFTYLAEPQLAVLYSSSLFLKKYSYSYFLLTCHACLLCLPQL